MPEIVVIQDMHKALVERQFPTITQWNRLEGRPRREDFDRALRAEVRDPLWMLCKQWQLGEFLGDDAGSPIFAKIHMGTTRLSKYRPAEKEARAFSDEVPLEAQVENRPLPVSVGDQYLSLDLRLLMGRQWLKLVNKAVGNFDLDFIARYPISQPEPDNPAHAPVVAHPEAWQQVAAVAGRAMDGYALYRYLNIDPSHHAYDGTSIPAFEQGTIDDLATKFVAWFERLYFQPAENLGEAWRPAHLEYQFSCSAPAADGETVYVASEYYHGRLDWHNVDVDPNQDSLDIPGSPATPDPRQEVTASFVPVQLTYEGMPNTRWWSFEDRKTSFGDIEPATTDLSKLLFLEFGLICANDWFIIPHALPAGSIARVEGMAVTNVFGERTWIEPAGKGPDDDWQRWSMFTITTQGEGDEAADNSLLLLPTVPKIQEGQPVEEILLIRDEMANMVWGVETRIPLATGGSKAGSEAAHELHNFYQRLLEQAFGVGTLAPPQEEAKAPIRYRVMSSVPENWIPLIPVHVPGDNRQIQLQRAAMPRILENDSRPPEKVRPRTILLREGFDKVPKRPLLIHEEEVPRAGVRVTQSYQRTRWYGGRVVTWFGVRKRTGRGEGASGLVFDSLIT